MYEKTLRKHLNEIIDNLGIENEELVKKYKDFKLEITNRMYKSKSGDYNKKTRKIRITQTSSHNNANEVSTALHELAHHLDNCNRKDTDHSKLFYDEFRKLIYSALDLDKISLEEMQEMNRSNSDYSKVQKILKEYERKDPIISKSNNLMYEINVFDLAADDPRLIAHGYQYNQRRKTWYRNIAPEAVELEKKLLEMLDLHDIQLKDANTIQMLDDEAEYMAYQKDLEDRKKTVLERSKKEYESLKIYINRMISNGFDFENLCSMLDGYPDNSDDHESFRFRYITLAGTINNQGDQIKLEDKFDIYEYREKDSRLVLKNVNMNNIESEIQGLR